MPVGAIGGLNQNSGVVRAGDVPPDTKVQEIGSGGAGGGGCKCGKCGGGGKVRVTPAQSPDRRLSNKSNQNMKAGLPPAFFV